MSQSPPNYMDRVPVKISERFKPPPKITLPQSVLNRLAQIESGGASRATTFSSYEFELEETVLKRITEWRAVRERERYERDERVRLKEQERKRLAEEEQKRKLNQICYPNTDDLSSDEDEPSEENDESSPSGSSEEQRQQQQHQPNGALSVVSASSVQYSQLNKYDTILMPTVLPEVVSAGGNNAAGSERQTTFGSESALSFNNIPKSTNLLNNNNAYNKINYSDFENDTSSPFDNVELKSMNDLDILAQVLNLNVSNSDPERSTSEANEKVENLNIKNQSNETSAESNAKSSPAQQSPDQGQQQTSQYQPTTQYPLSQHPQANSYYKTYNTSYQYGYGGGASQYPPSSTASPAWPDSTYLNHYNNLVASSTSSYQPQQQQPTPHYQSYHHQQPGNTYSYFPYTSSTSSSSSQATQPTYAHAYPYTGGYGQSGYSYPNPSAGISYTPTMESSSVVAAAVEGGAIKSKSKSVPDIVRQLDEEVQDSAQRRTRNNSQSVAENHPTTDRGTQPVVTQSSTQNFTVYNGLSQVEQNLVKRISSMGFPLERVASVLKRIGSDDKKIVEHLIPLSELLDLGFEEEKISDALVKFGNNKHKALDYLIS